MEQQIHADLLRLASDSERARQEHRDKKRALLEKFTSKEHALQESFDHEQALIDKRRAHLFLQLASSTQRFATSGIAQLELEPVTSSSPDDTLHLHAADQVPELQQQQHLHLQSNMLALPERPHDAPSSKHSSHDHPASEPEQLQGHTHLEHEASADQQPLGDADMQYMAPASSPVTESAHAENAEQTPADLHESAENAESDVEIDVTHVIPLAEQREPGTSTFMICRPRRRRSKSCTPLQLTTKKHGHVACIQFAKQQMQSTQHDFYCRSLHQSVWLVCPCLSSIWPYLHRSSNTVSSVADKVACAWPAELWKPLQLEPVIAELVSETQSAAQPCAPTKLQTNDEALVENKDVARLVNVADMTPAM